MPEVSPPVAENENPPHKLIDRHDPEILKALTRAPLYKKKGEVQVVFAKGGEEVSTTLANGVEETKNNAQPGDAIVTNPGGEQYIVPADKFGKKYEAKAGEPGVYLAKGYCRAIRNPYEEPIEMEASWGEKINGATDCLIADSYDPETKALEGEPYIIAPQEFEETYAGATKIFYLAGALGTSQGGEQIQAQLAERFGAEEVAYLPSIISTDQISSTRYQDLAEAIVANSTKNEVTTVVVHSFGVQELYQVMKELEKTGSTEHLKNLACVLVVPFGLMENLTEFYHPLKVIEVVRSQVNLGPLNNFRHGIESLNYLPPANLDVSRLEEVMRELFNPASKELLATDGADLPSFSSLRSREGHLATLPAEKQQQLQESVRELDESMDQIITREKLGRTEKALLKSLLRKRGQILAQPMTEAYEGGEPAPQQSWAESYREMVRVGLGLMEIISQMASGEIAKALRELRDKGGSIQCILPEYDVIYSLDQLTKLLRIDREEALELVAILTGTTHASFAMNAGGLADALESLVKPAESP